MDAKRFDAIARTLNLSAASRLDRLAAALAASGSRRWVAAAGLAGLGLLAGVVEPASAGKKKRKGRNKKKKDRKDKEKPQCVPLAEEPCGPGCCDALNRPCCNGVCCDFGWKCCGGRSKTSGVRAGPASDSWPTRRASCNASAPTPTRDPPSNRASTPG